MSSKNKTSESASSPVKRSFIMLAWVGVLVVGLWALMNYSTPESNLEPYNKFQDAKAKPEKKKSQAEPEKPEFKLPSDLDTGNLIKAAMTVPATQAQLPRETLEHIQKGMLLTEEGKFNAGDMEFEKAAEISPNSPELFSIWGPL